MASDLNSLADVRAKELINEYATNTVHRGLDKYDPTYQLSEVAAMNGGGTIQGLD